MQEGELGGHMPDLSQYVLSLSRQRLDIRDLGREWRSIQERRRTLDAEADDVLRRLEIAEQHLDDLARAVLAAALSTPTPTP